MTEPKTEFRGWKIPGPIPPGALGHGPAVEPDETLDALGGHFRIFQLKNGHRFSTDDILTAWYGTSFAPTVRIALDLGSGIGTVATLAAWRTPGARFVTVEAQDQSIALARKSMQWNGLNERFDLRHGDFRDPSVLGSEEVFDLVLGSPPYFPQGTGIESDHPQKIACRFELRGDIRDYCQVASEHLGPGGLFACVFPVNPPEQHDRVRAAAAAVGLVIVRWRPVIFREPEPPLIGLFAMMRATDLPDWMRTRTWKEPPLIIRDQSGAIHPEYSAVKLSFGFPP
ncbi:MAG TPA: methyltransferase [Candidatus Kapabacteria bacterium]|nr:methyltransferase [Candidatus Kapabacteria bacterium]